MERSHAMLFYLRILIWIQMAQFYIGYLVPWLTKRIAIFFTSFDEILPLIICSYLVSVLQTYVAHSLVRTLPLVRYWSCVYYKVWLMFTFYSLHFQIKTVKRRFELVWVSEMESHYFLCRFIFQVSCKSWEWRTDWIIWNHYGHYNGLCPYVYDTII